MGVASERLELRHPWLAHFEKAPKTAFSELLSGYAEIHPYERLEAPEAAKVLFGSLPPEDGARTALGPTIIGWLEHQRDEALNVRKSTLQRRIREICEALEIVSLLQLSAVALDLRHRRETWGHWFEQLASTPARDARAEFFRTLALTQRLAAESDPNIVEDELASTWHALISRGGADLPASYRCIGELGLREISPSSANAVTAYRWNVPSRNRTISPA